MILDMQILERHNAVAIFNGICLTRLSGLKYFCVMSCCVLNMPLKSMHLMFILLIKDFG